MNSQKAQCHCQSEGCERLMTLVSLAVTQLFEI